MNGTAIDPCQLALRVREHVIRMAGGGGCFLGASLSCADLIVHLYTSFLRVDPANPRAPDRDCLLLSKGHDVPALYATLAELGFFETERLAYHLSPDDHIYWHPNRAIPGVEFHSGSLGHLLSVGMGIAYDARLRGSDSRVVVLLGDGELNEGSIWEALLVASALQLDNLIVVIDRNGFQANVATESLTPLEPLAAKFQAFRCSAIDVDGHDFAALASAFDSIPFQTDVPVVIIANTVRGRGVPSIEARADRWFCRLSESEVENMIAELHGETGAGLRLRDTDGPVTASYEQVLGMIAEADERYVVMTAENRAAIRNLPARIGDRFIDVGIAEQTLVGMAAGLALRGRIPVVHALATFLTMRSFEFIRTDVGIGGLAAKLVGYVPGVLSDGNGPTHQALEDLSLMRGIPGMRVFCPADLDDLLIGLPVILADADPWYIRYTDRPAVVSHDPVFTPGRAETLMDGDDICFVVAGVLLREAIEAARLLQGAGLSVRVLNIRTIKPFDHHAVLDGIRGARLTVTIEDHFLTGGLHTAVAESLLRVGATATVLPVAFAERWFAPALLPDLLRHEGLLGPQLADRTLTALHRLDRT